jgi:hypothetical protein
MPTAIRTLTQCGIVDSIRRCCARVFEGISEESEGGGIRTHARVAQHNGNPLGKSPNRGLTRVPRRALQNQGEGLGTGKDSSLVLLDQASRAEARKTTRVLHERNKLERHRPASPAVESAVAFPGSN